MGNNELQANYLTIPVYVWGALVFIAVARISDRYRVRGAVSSLHSLSTYNTRLIRRIHKQAIICTNIVGIVGYILLLTVTTGGVRYFATFCCVTATYVGPGLNLAWLNANTAPHYKRAAAIGTQQSMGNSAGIVAGQVYRAAPYVLGNAFSLGALCVSQIMIATLLLCLKRQNTAKQEIARGAMADQQEERSGDAALGFIYDL